MPTDSSAVYQCPICKLHYLGKALADDCYAWCSTHSSCRLAIARQSMEARKAE